MELAVKGICKSFGAGNVLDGVDFSVKSGEICALLGENGAGKSTLMNIIGGVFPADSGKITLDGRAVTFDTPAESLETGIAFIHQEMNIVNDLTVYENMFLTGFPKKGPFLDRKKMISETERIFEQLGIGIDPCTLAVNLDTSYKKMVEIAQAILADASFIIMDEPTAALTGAEIERLFGIMKNLRDKGIAMIFITHKLGEVMAICDRYTVLRNGKCVSAGNISDVSERKLASFMVGHDVEEVKKHIPAEYGEEVLRLDELTDTSDEKLFSDVSFSVRRGEILGVTGLMGDGRSEVFKTVFGLRGKHYRGRIFFHGEKFRPDRPETVVKRGIAYLPKNRKENAVFPMLSVLDNGTSVTLRDYCRFGLLDNAEQKKAFSEQSESLRIRMTDPEYPINTLSGGNQQKVIFARWLLPDPEVLILDNPTQGVDVGAKEEIYEIIEGLASKGIAVIVLSPEAREMMRVCDRCLVMYHGEVVGKLEAEEMNETDIMYLATGGGRSSARKN